MIVAESTHSCQKHLPLQHKVLDNSMKCASFEVKRFAHAAFSFLSSTQQTKVFCSGWSNILVQLHDNTTDILVTVLDLEENVRIISFRIGK